jgi:3-hydroxyacyl-CoA dehydrogenase
MTYLNEALGMVISGVPMQQIDAAMVEFGMPLGPLQLLDEIGLDTALQSGVVLAEIFGERSGGSELLVRLVKAQQLGMKVGAGFYNYPTRTPNPSCGKIIGALRTPEKSSMRARANHAMIAEQLFLPMIAEAARMLGEKKNIAAWQIDLAMIFGIGFPLWRGGPLWWAETFDKEIT